MIVSGIFAAFLLSAVFFYASASEREKLYYSEPDVRPSVPEDAVWDSELGMYISGDFTKDDSGKYVVREEKFYSDQEDSVSPEQAWRSSHNKSTNEIDMAIWQSINTKETDPSLLLWSSISPRDYKSVMDAMHTLHVSSLPELWERVCTEPAYRPLKLVALEEMMNLPLDYGLYDSMAQKMWYDTFLERKNSIPAENISMKDVEIYGNLLLPILAEKLKSDTITKDEMSVFVKTIQEASNTGFVQTLEFEEKADGQNILEAQVSKKKLSGWVSQNEELIHAINEVINSSWQWVY